jgi:predicted metal-dependent hydrolase
VTTERHQIEVTGIPVEVVRKDIKNLHLAVYPPRGRVRVAVPLRLDDEAVRLAVVSRLGWIRRRRAEYVKQDRQSEREMVTGESHFLWGRRYRLNIIEHDAPTSVRLLNNSTLEMRARLGADREAREVALHRWHRQLLRERIPGLVAKWEPVVGVTVSDIRVRRMKTRWGSCNASAGRIWLNPELVKKPPSCLEYIFVHEMVHFLERHHNDLFKELMNRFMPQWRLHRDDLNCAPLAHEDWEY